MILILAKSHYTSELLPPIICDVRDFKDGGIYYMPIDGEDIFFLPNESILSIKRDISLEAVHKLLSTLENPIHF
jgi:hypothetical protein